MLISERVRHEKLVTGSARLMQSTNSSAAVEEKNKFEKQTKEKNEKLNPGRNRWFYLAGCGLIFVLVFLVRNFLNED